MVADLASGHRGSSHSVDVNGTDQRRLTADEEEALKKPKEQGDT